MTLQQEIRAALASIVSDRVSYGLNMTEPPVYPYAVFLFVSSTSNVTLGGPTDMQNSRVQIDIFSRDPAEARALLNQAFGAMLATFTVGAVTSQDFPPDPDTRAFRASADFSVWSTTA